MPELKDPSANALNVSPFSNVTLAFCPLTVTVQFSDRISLAFW
ncbi:hypothetical protein MFUM_760009 [Methylacidiphilum fumariolicum SolV]|uniref:Uncharacterized protein n=1 Tax=Methylacidiphilum fumariolicum (strain SolV) TaxID=1156937 RepID=I0JZS4_METFB|nr:hypothetical protein MFUM_760009 [Methylacidiphilum fumariolicum SolV]